jgi:hypothetical protein
MPFKKVFIALSADVSLDVISDALSIRVGKGDNFLEASGC